MGTSISSRTLRIDNGLYQGGKSLREQTTIRLPSELKKEIQQQADERGESFNGLVLIMLQKALKIINHEKT